MDRGFAGALVALARHHELTLSPPAGAAQIASVRRADAKSVNPLSPCPLSHKGRGGISHQKEI
ncbi:MAG: hypothetical protein WCK70_17405 [Chloroflexales bacterium]